MDIQVNINNEKWRPIAGYEGMYECSSLGRIYSVLREYTGGFGAKCHTGGRFPYITTTPKGYLMVSLTKNGITISKRINRLVYETFIGTIPEGYDVHHKNHNTKDNRVENLELIDMHTHRKMHFEENKEHLISKMIKGVIQYTLEGEFVAEYTSIAEAERKTNIKKTNICKCCKCERQSAGGFIWKYKEAS